MSNRIQLNHIYNPLQTSLTLQSVDLPKIRLIPVYTYHIILSLSPQGTPQRISETWMSMLILFQIKCKDLTNVHYDKVEYRNTTHQSPITLSQACNFIDNPDFRRTVLGNFMGTFSISWLLNFKKIWLNLSGFTISF